MNGKLRLWTLPLGFGFWGLVGAGIYTEQPAFFGVAVGLAVLTIVIVLVTKSKAHSALLERRKQVWENGLPGVAKVLSIYHGGGGVNRDPKIDFKLEVTPEGEEAYPVSTSAIIEQIFVSQVQPESEVKVRIDPNDRDFVVIDKKITSPWYLAGDRQGS